MDACAGPASPWGLSTARSTATPPRPSPRHHQTYDVTVDLDAFDRDEEVAWPDAARVVGDAGDLDVAVPLQAGVRDGAGQLGELILTLSIIGAWSAEIGGRRFEWGSRTYVMGIVNVTPDSFSGDGLGDDAEPPPPRALGWSATARTCSTSEASRPGPGHVPITAAEEIGAYRRRGAPARP